MHYSFYDCTVSLLNIYIYFFLVYFLIADIVCSIFEIMVNQVSELLDTFFILVLLLFIYFFTYITFLLLFPESLGQISFWFLCDYYSFFWCQIFVKKRLVGDT